LKRNFCFTLSLDLPQRSESTRVPRH